MGPPFEFKAWTRVSWRLTTERGIACFIFPLTFRQATLHVPDFLSFERDKDVAAEGINDSGNSNIPRLDELPPAILQQ
jgi:hypothetical protein